MTDGREWSQAEDGIRDSSTSRGLGDVYKRQTIKYEVDMMTTATGLLVNDALYDFDLVDDHIRSSNYQIHSFCCTSYMC